MIVRTVIATMMLALLLEAHADPSPSPSLTLPLGVTLPPGAKIIGIKKVGYQIRAYGQSSPAVRPLATFSTEIPPLSSLFWDRPFVLSLQQKASELLP